MSVIESYCAKRDLWRIQRGIIACGKGRTSHRYLRFTAVGIYVACSGVSVTTERCEHAVTMIYTTFIFNKPSAVFFSQLGKALKNLCLEFGMKFPKGNVLAERNPNTA